MRFARLVQLALLVVASTALLPAIAAGADRIYWTSVVGAGGGVSFANLAGGGEDVNTAGAKTSQPAGVAIDAAHGTLYWANSIGGPISFVGLASGGAANLNTTGATVSGPTGVAIDAAGGRLYWANSNADKISFLNLGSPGAGDLDTTGATLSIPTGIAVDPVAGKVYWTNIGAGGKISFAKLTGGGGGDLDTTGATVQTPIGIAVDPAAGIAYWANTGANKISFAKLAGGGGGDLKTTGATVSSPEGIAIDAAAGRIYWANATGGKISFANLANDGQGGDLATTGATITSSSFPALLKAPLGTAPPTATGGTTAGSPLSCTQGTWASDISPSFLFRMPQTFSYQWSRNGADIAGATQSSLTPEPAGGDYRCRVTATNAAGSTSQTSAAAHVPAAPGSVPGTGPRTGPGTGSGTSVAASAVVSALALKPARFFVGGSRGGTRIGFRLDRASSATLAFDRLLPGHIKGKRCLTTVRQGKRCTAVHHAGSLTVAGRAGVNSVKFSGKLGRKALAPGSYRLTATPAHGKARTLRFVVVRAPASTHHR